MGLRQQLIINGMPVPVSILRDLPSLSDGGYADWCKVETGDGQRHIVRKSQLIQPAQSVSGEEIELHAFQIDSKRTLRKGLRFRTIAGTGPRYNGEPNGEVGRFVCLRIWTQSNRVYCFARSEKRGGVHTLYLDGPVYLTEVGSVMHPYRLKLVK